MSRRFDKAYRKSNAMLKGLAEGATRDVVQSIRSDRAQFKRRYDRLAHLPDVLEVDVTGGHRLIAYCDAEVLRLLDFGGHEVVPRYTGSMFYLDRLQNLSAPPQFYPEQSEQQLRFFTRNPCRSFEHFGVEQSRQWVDFLSEQQSQVTEEVIAKFCETYTSDLPMPASFILGGPGTGKTNILVNLLKDLTDLGFQVGIDLSDAVTRYLEACMPDAPLRDFLVDANGCTNAAGFDVDIVLVDDPRDELTIRNWLDRVSSGRIRSVVLAFDPCQLSSFDVKKKASGITDVDFEGMVRQHGVDVFELNACYRQKENLGKASKKAMDVIAESTPFLDSQKIRDFREGHRHLTEVANDLTFPNRHGYIEIYDVDSLDDLRLHFGKEIDRIAGMPLWSHWPPVLFVIDNSSGSRAVEYANNVCTDPPKPFPCDSHGHWLGDVGNIKGLEYQHLLLFLGRDLYLQLESGFRGSGQAAYNQRRLIRIPFSRAKDSMVIFVC